MRPMAAPGCKRLHMRHCEPILHDRDRLRHAEPAAGDARMRENSQERGDGLPGQTDGFSAREYLFKPTAGIRMLGACGVVGVDEQIDVDDDHLCAGPSRASMSSFTFRKRVPSPVPSANGFTTKRFRF